MTISIEAWTSRVKEHSLLLSPFADAFHKRRSLKLSHPVHDFLFTYYSFSPQKLKQWVPSFEENLECSSQLWEDYPWLNEYWFSFDGRQLSLNRERVQGNIIGLTKFVENLCSNIMQQPPRFSCFGLHEWAMVYKLTPEELRHKNHTLRLSPQEIANFIESQTLCCSHYDAFRFFTKEASPLNTITPRLDTRLQNEQGGCLHVNMDLYKWSTKLWPWVGSDFIRKAFFHALEGRELDMRASPYGLSAEGFSPICIETEEGRKQYQKEQRKYAERAIPLRKELLEFCTRFLSKFSLGRCCSSTRN